MMMFFGVAPANAGTLHYGSISEGTTLSSGDEIALQDSYLVMQSDGNLVFYVNDFQYPGTFYVCWATGTDNHAGARAVYQTDGNFVVYSTSNQALWSTETVGQSPNSARIEENGGYPQFYVANKSFGPYNCPDGWVG
ncbi:hypothetical protein [Subtercola sp. RTI3]|uniref:hypothetical protein n=1 Tax=Subtercola sp. RTI3 TaxID=3048639 RepID=UPI002B228159|nr:hypothetical protein [Subtercola sp. RTI3]